MSVEINKVITLGALIRVALVFYSDFHDQAMDLKYTDIDYHVFSDAAAHVSKSTKDCDPKDPSAVASHQRSPFSLHRRCGDSNFESPDLLWESTAERSFGLLTVPQAAKGQGGSPYDRETYRYTPLLAYMLLPNIYIHPLFGKMLFSLVDVLLGYLVYRILELRGTSPAVASAAASSWLLNPLPIVVSSRGNAESVMGCLVVGTLYLIMTQRNLLAACVFALAVHFKTYPIIYAPSIYLLINEQYGGNMAASKKKLLRVANLLVPSSMSLVYALVGAFVTLGLAALFYDMYGQVFLDETYFYHVTRKDTQHNFSIYFYPLRLAEDLGAEFSRLIGLSAFVPQCGATLAFTYKYYRDLPFCWFIITLAFVTFNKVCTSQYFLWYLCLLPLVAPSLRLTAKESALMFFLWLTAQGVWFAPAYYYEYHHYNILGVVWAASLYFFWINIWCLWKFVKSYSYSPLFTPGGSVRQQVVEWKINKRE